MTMGRSASSAVSAWLFALIAQAGCGGAGEAPAPAAAAGASAGAEASATRDPTAPIRVQGVGFKTPESALHDVRADRYLVSNIDGSPLELDDRAFISRIRPDGSVEQLKWIDAAQAGVELDAPKGMAIVGDVLYVADISQVRKFERVSGRPLGSIPIPGATFINDLCADRAGNVYASDSGLSTGLTPSGSDAIYKIGPGDKLTTLAKDVALGRPNGLLASGDELWVVTFGSGELYRLDADGQRAQIEKLPKGSLDGIVRLKERLFVSSWEASAVFERSGGSFVERVSELPAPSDIGVDERRGRLLIPLFNDDTLVIQPL
jgi:hypothetical protein